MSRSAKNVESLVACTLVWAALSGCAAPSAVVRQGDRVALSFDCRLPGGELAVTTRPETALAGERRSGVYLPRTGPATVEVTAGGGAVAGEERIPFEQEVLQRLAPLTVGLRQGERAQITLSAGRFPVSSPKEKTVRVARVRKRPKELRMTPLAYREQTGKAPAVGEAYGNDKAFAGKVVEAGDQEVVVRFVPAAGEALATPLGKATVRELPDRYELEIAATRGELVRVGPIVGQVAEIDDAFMTMDFGHPFGSATLACDVEVVQVESPVPGAAQGAGPAGKAAPAAARDAGDLDPARVEELVGALRAMNAGAGKGAEPGGNGAAAALPASAGDLARVDYTARLEDGTVIYSTRKEVADDVSLKKAPWFGAPANLKPEPMAVGGRAVLPGVGEALAGMAAGEKKRLVLPPERAFGPSDPAKMERLPLTRTLPRRIIIAAQEYVSRFGSFPVAGKEVPLTPYFPARVEAVREHEAEMVLLAENGKSYRDPFGTTTVAVDVENVVTVLTPVLGSTFPGPTGSGIITRSDGTSFTLDTNNPLAGKTVIIDLELASLTSNADLPAGEPPWRNDHDAALARAKKDGKPAVLILYADWCGFCKRLFGETIPDPRIREVRDRFAWIKANSDKDAELRARYGQNGFPMVVLFNADGSQAVKLDGYQEASKLRAALEELH